MIYLYTYVYFRRHHQGFLLSKDVALFRPQARSRLHLHYRIYMANLCTQFASARMFSPNIVEYTVHVFHTVQHALASNAKLLY